MQALRLNGSGVGRQLWRAGILTAALTVSAPLSAQVAASDATQGSSDVSAFRSLLRSSGPAPMPITGRAGRNTLGFTATISSSDFDGLDDNITQILALKPQVTFGRYVSDRLAIEVPLSILSEKEDDEDDRSTDIEIGIRPVGTLFGSESVAGVISLFGGIRRNSEGDESSTRFMWEIGAGPEFQLNNAVSLRTRLVYGSVAEDEDNGFPKENYFGLNVDLIHNLNATGTAPDGNILARFGANYTKVDFDDADGFSQIEIPSPFIGVYFGVGEAKRMRLGTDLQFQRESFGDFSARNLILLPTIEYDFGPADGAGFRVHGMGMLWNIAADAGGGSDESGWINGIGGGIGAWINMTNEMNMQFLLDYLKTMENEDLGVPAGNVVRFGVGVEFRH